MTPPLAQAQLGNSQSYISPTALTGLNKFELYERAFLNFKDIDKQTVENVASNLFNSVAPDGSLFITSATNEQVEVILNTGFGLEDRKIIYKDSIELVKPKITYDFSLGYIKPDAVSRSLESKIIEEIGSRIDVVAVKKTKLDEATFQVLYFESQSFTHFPRLRQELVDSEVPFFLVQGSDAIDRLNDVVQKLRKKYGLNVLQNSVHSSNKNRVIPEVYSIFRELYKEVVLK